MKEKDMSLIEKWHRWGRPINGKRFMLISIAKADLRKVIDELKDDRTYPTAIINLEKLKQKIGLDEK